MGVLAIAICVVAYRWSFVARTLKICSATIAPRQLFFGTMTPDNPHICSHILHCLPLITIHTDIRHRSCSNLLGPSRSVDPWSGHLHCTSLQPAQCHRRSFWIVLHLHRPGRCRRQAQSGIRPQPQAHLAGVQDWPLSLLERSQEDCID